MFSQLVWKIKRLFRKLFRREWKHTQQDLTVTFLETATRLATKGKAEVQVASLRNLAELLDDDQYFVYLVVFKTRKFGKPKRLKSRGWFDQYTFPEKKR